MIDEAMPERSYDPPGGRSNGERDCWLIMTTLRSPPTLSRLSTRSSCSKAVILLGEVISGDGVVRSRVWGPCPGCGHHTDDRQTHTAVTGVSGGELRGTDRGVPGAGAADSKIRYPQVDISSRCSNVHAAWTAR